MITIKKIADTVNDENAKIHYYVYDENEMSDHLMYLKVVSDDERKTYNGLSDEEKKEYVSTSSEIYLPKMSVDNCVRIYTECVVSYDYQYTYNKVINLAEIEKNDINVAVVLYMVLHEFGHWHDLASKGNKVYAYSEASVNEGEKACKFGNEVQSRLSYKTTFDEKDMELLKQATLMYHSIPVEQKANQYADLNYRLAYDKLRNKGLVS